MQYNQDGHLLRRKINEIIARLIIAENLSAKSKDATTFSKLGKLKQIRVYLEDLNKKKEEQI